MRHRKEVYTIKQVMNAAKGLFEGGQGDTEYARGVCELIGRLRLDSGGLGEGTGENASAVASKLGVKTRSDK